MNGAQIILEMLRRYDVKHVFGLPGETTLELYDEWHNYPDIEYILTRDEKNSAFMAEAYAKVTGKPGVFESPSPGVAHPAPAVAEAYAGSIPLIFFSSDVYPNDDKRNMLTGMDQTEFYSSICKESFVLDRAEEIPFLIRRAFRTATSGRPGPVHLRVMWNSLSDTAEVKDLYAQSQCSRYPSFRFIADPAAIEKGLDILLSAANPLMICGQGALSSAAADTVQALAESLQIPVATTTTGKGAITETHPLAVGVVGARGGTAFTNGFIEDADVIFYLGSNTDSTGTDGWKLPDRYEGKTIVQLDIAPENLGNIYNTQVSMCGDVRATLEYMLKLIAENRLERSASVSDLTEKRELARRKLLESPIPAVNRGIFPPRFLSVLNDLIPDNTIITSEAGVASIYTTPLWQLKKPGRRYLTNYSLGALGYAVPAALGAAFADENAPVMALTGDGGFGFNCGELETIARAGKNITIILFRNNTFGWIKGETVMVNDSVPFCTDFSKNVDYQSIAEAFGLQCQKLTEHENIRAVLEKALNYQGPSFIEMEVVSQDIIAPFVPKWVNSAKKKKIPYIY